jgi:hypothetical protein
MDRSKELGVDTAFGSRVRILTEAFPCRPKRVQLPLRISVRSEYAAHSPYTFCLPC